MGKSVVTTHMHRMYFACSQLSGWKCLYGRMAEITHTIRIRCRASAAIVNGSALFTSRRWQLARPRSRTVTPIEWAFIFVCDTAANKFLSGKTHTEQRNYGDSKLTLCAVFMNWIMVLRRFVRISSVCGASWARNPRVSKKEWKKVEWNTCGSKQVTERIGMPLK